MAQLKDKNPTIKLWCQLAKNNLLIVCLLQFMKLVELEIVQIICRLEN
jgi:hypothetical protein